MSAARVRRPAARHARGSVPHLLGVLILVLATFAFSCAGAMPSPDAGTSRPTSAHAVHIADRDPCQEGPHHGCHTPGHHGVLNHAPSIGADRAAALNQLSTAPARLPLGLSRIPGAARPPDLHELQLLRV
ncbi:hypothetical protein GCM10023084_59830 [Streptomyces lacrimifluminis]|uniref:Uncharacterized protein n=1 Tax=Streptomyces lacrimifluminis TaxID=1500077 RepID=A0A917LB37_9ACTN|nr:hypothetical protein [Streptomyces lacrimifluminis]GGJ57031.1 hypothetical protein GCM10012282_62780 [Streptomyces lacrimifluminis]